MEDLVISVGLDQGTASLCGITVKHRLFEVLLGGQGRLQAKTSNPGPPERDRDTNPGWNGASCSQTCKTDEWYVVGLWKIVRIDH